ncbi:unnamed protein product [Oncorhynchus mykiss]|uniref:Cadherin domain-containing protein n=1 Tax=Oncorhynchus mykiss TaxID=8022 RepID=A0A060YCL5_ONCMY|nr:unnamed protein product [Oncorhynchus mykiss]
MQIVRVTIWLPVQESYGLGVKTLEALVGSEPVEGPVIITINVLDVNNHAPSFNQTDYIGIVRERTPAGVPFARVFATDLDDPESPNAHLSYTLVSQIPNRDNTLFFEINSNTGEISTTAEGNTHTHTLPEILKVHTHRSSQMLWSLISSCMSANL